MTQTAYDYIIVGAGSAGCVLANRLTEDGDASVLLLEAGGTNRSLFIDMPTALAYPMRSMRFNWGYESVAEPHLGGRIMPCPRGKGLGGSSSINGMVYVRGHAKDFDAWEALGCTGWGYQNCLPYFRRAETWIQGGDEYRGKSGPIATCNGNNMRNPLYRAFIDAGVQAGYSATSDYNGFQQEGFGAMHMTVGDGVRASTARGYLRPAMHRSNLTVWTDTQVVRINIHNQAARGVEALLDGKATTLDARREVIVAAGAVGTPVLLQCSGVGPVDVLRDAGVEIVHELPGVGANMQDHLEVLMQVRCNQPITLNSRLGLISRGLIGARWLINKSGLGATNHFEACAFIRSKAGVAWPDIQYHFVPGAISYDMKTAFGGHGYQVHVGPNKAKSRGSVRIVDGDSASKPELLFNYLQHPDDVDDFRRCIRLTREILQQPALARYSETEITPGDDVQSDDEIDAFVRETAGTAYHVSCTAKMGSRGDPTAVVDPACHVIGLAKLRVVDSSVFPEITNGNLNAPTIMLAERMSDIIRGREPLPAANVPVFEHPNWQYSQR